MSSTNMSGGMMDEYTDYSCSTSIERLARDVETALRSWHVADGSDRHASISSSRSLTNLSSSSLSADTNKKHILSQQNSSTMIRLIRSQTIAWHLSFYIQSSSSDGSGGGGGGGVRNISCPFELELSLWDGPPTTAVDTVSSTADSAYSQLLPFSLHRSSTSITACSNQNDNVDTIFDNFSTLFGIGQHITLTPSLGELHKQQQQQQQQSAATSSSTDSRELWEYLSESIHTRHHFATSDDDTTAACAATTTILSTWLQTALNWAAAECHCYIPIFGVWGLYQPSSSSSRNRDGIIMRDSMLFPTWLPLLSSQWAKQQQQASRSQKRNPRGRSNNNGHRSVNHLNRRYTSPIMSGTCISQDYETIFWTTFQPLQLSQHSPPPPRLTEWGSILLRHCPRNHYSSNNNKKVALWGARHVYSWKKAAASTQKRRPLLAAIFQVEKQSTATWRQQPKTQASSSSAHQDPYNSTTMMDVDHDNNRNNNPIHHQHDDGDNEVKQYRLDCRHYALQLMEQAAGATIANPMWGPPDDPIADIYVTISWNNCNTDHQKTATAAATRQDGDDDLLLPQRAQQQPLLYLPLNIRSKQRGGMSREDILEAEATMEQGILDPFRPTGSFLLQVHGDVKIPHASLAASQRCILAALIRTATLPSETLLWHLVDEKVMDRWDSSAGNVIAATLADKAKVSSSTKALVAAMDWADAPEDMIETHQADEIVQAALDPSISLGFPCPPEPALSGGGDGDKNQDNNNHNDEEHDDNDSPLWQPFLKSAPIGRLVSLLFVHMAKVRSPCSMVLVFSAFIEELRRRWDYRESLPNMNYVPGLDPLLSLEQVQMATKRCSISSPISDLSKATLAAHVNASEPDPDDFHCLIGQKLQVFNLCLETSISEELRLVEQMEKQTNSPQARGQDSYLQQQEHNTLHSALQPPSPNHTLLANSAGGGMLSGPPLPARLGQAAAMGANRQEMVSIIEGLPAISAFDMSGMTSNNHNHGGGAGVRFDDTKSVATGRSMATKSQLYFDAEEGDFDDFLNDNVDMEDSSNESVAPEGLWLQQHQQKGPSGAAAEAGATAQGRNNNNNDSHSASRKGARCPIYGMMLANGDQAYAPYLQRPSPMTDDIIAERRLMLSRQDSNFLVSHSSKLSSQERRLEVVHRLQRDKLLSDMSAFKAANPNATFDDFVAWYGKPTNPLEEYEARRQEQEQKGVRVGASTQEKLQSQHEKVIEANRIVERTHAFWLQTWKEARPIPANEQEPLFNAENAVEVSLDYLEMLHPAVLLCNVMSANLAVAYFTLLFSAGDALRVAHVTSSLAQLRRKIEIALKLLSLDATLSGTRQQGGPGDARPGGYSVLSLQTLTACEAACQVMQDAEVHLARAVSLLHKFPNQYRLIDSIFQQPDGARINVDDENAQHHILRMIRQHQQQQHHHAGDAATAEQPTPCLREYILRNMDDSNPCQLCVRYGDKRMGRDNEDEDGGGGGLLMALSRTHKAST